MTLTLITLALAGALAWSARRAYMDDKRRIAAADRRAQSPHQAFADALENAPDAFTKARANRAALEAMSPASVRAGDYPDADSPRFVWWLPVDPVLTDADRATLPRWLQGMIPAGRIDPSIQIHPGIGPCPFVARDPVSLALIIGPSHSIVITARELNLCLVLPGRVTDLKGGIVPLPKPDRPVPR
jgi:hypothetical protein